MRNILKQRIPKRALYLGFLVLGIGLFGGHIWLLNKVDAEWVTTARQVSELESAIIAEANLPPEQRYTADRDAIIAKSSKSSDYAKLQKREQSLSTMMGSLILGLMIWPVLIIALSMAGWAYYWKGRGLEPRALEGRRQRMRVIATIAVASLLTITIVWWRFSASRFGPSSSLTMALIVAIVTVFFVQVVWSLLLSPRTRLRTGLRPVSPIYRFSVQAGIVALIAFTTLSDLTSLRVEREVYFRGAVDSFILLAIQSVAWLSTVLSLGSVMLGYLRLPEKEPHEVMQQTQDALELQPSKDLRLSGPFVLSPKEGSELGILSDRIATLTTLLKPANDRSDSRESHKKQRALKSDEVVALRSELTRQRLLSEVLSLTRRGNLNLIIGSLTSLIAATILWMLVARAPLGTLGSAALVGYYVPRISVAVFIEVFSFFFLRLYRNGLSEIMYYQNELTSLESRTLALEIAALLPSKDTVPQLLLDLSKTDRNFVLKRGETTVELEKIKVDQENLHSLFDSLASKMTELKDALK